MHQRLLLYFCSWHFLYSQKIIKLFVSWLSGPHGTPNFDHLSMIYSDLIYANKQSFGFYWRNNASILLKITCTSTATSSYEPCLDEYALKVGNGVCDDASNIESCNYDGGDCCGDTGMYWSRILLIFLLYEHNIQRFSVHFL